MMTLQEMVDIYRSDRRLNVFVDPRRQQVSGVLARESQYVFSYVQTPQPPMTEVALGLPWRLKSYSSGDLFSVFAMNEPEGYLKTYIELALQRIGVPDKLFFLMMAQGLQIGRVDYRHPVLALPDSEPEPLDALLHEHAGGYFAALMQRYALRSGLSGAQPKVIVPTSLGPVKTEGGADPVLLSGWSKHRVTTQDLIVKSAGDEFPGLALNEFFCMSVARRAGLDVPDFWLSDDAKRFVIARFDRTGDGSPIGFEDMACLAGVTAARKYQGSYEGILRIVARYCPSDRAAVEAVWVRIALSALVKDGDAHLKNFGLLYDTPTADIRPAPVYDVVSTAIYPALDREMALKMNKARSFPTTKELHRLGLQAGLAPEKLNLWTDRINAAVDEQLLASRDDPRFAGDTLGTLKALQDVLRPSAAYPRF